MNQKHKFQRLQNLAASDCIMSMCCLAHARCCGQNITTIRRFNRYVENFFFAAAIAASTATFRAADGFMTSAIFSADHLNSQPVSSCTRQARVGFGCRDGYGPVFSRRVVPGVVLWASMDEDDDEDGGDVGFCLFCVCSGCLI